MKISELPAHPLPVSTDDLLALVEVGAVGGAVTRRVTVGDLLAGSGADFAGPPHVHGFFYPASRFTGALAPAAPPTNKVWFMPIVLQRLQRVNGLAVMVTTGQAAALARVALYADAQDEEGPAALLAQTAALDCSGAAGFRVGAVDVTVPAAGVYWLGVNFQGFVAGAVGWNGFQTALALCGFTATGPHVAMSQNLAFGAFPDLFNPAGLVQDPSSQAPQPFYRLVGAA